MKVNQNVSIFVGPQTNDRTWNGTDKKAQNNKTILATTLNGQFDPIEQKRALAKKRAYKVVGDTFSSERKLDDELKGRLDRIKELQKEKGEANREIKAINEEEEKLREMYGVDKDSQEQKDLDLIKKYNRYKSKAGYPVPRWNEDFSEEEKQRMEELQEQGKAEGYTEYQKRVLDDLEPGKYPHEEKIRDCDKDIFEESGIIRETAKERLKYHPMLDAQKEADKILGQASDEIIGMLVDEAKENIDEKQEEEQEKLEERKEEKKEEDKKLEEAQLRKAELEAMADPERADEYEKKLRRKASQSDSVSGDNMTEDMLKLDGVQDTVKQEVQDIMLEMKLVAENMKGIKIDEEV